MTQCNVCGKIFGASGRAVCPSCRKKLDAVYEKARTYLRDNPKENLRGETLAKAIGEDPALVEILVAEGKFDIANDGPIETEEDRRRKQLLADLQRSLSTPSKTEEQTRTTYGSDRHAR